MTERPNTPTGAATTSYPRLAARTRNFTLGTPQAFTVAPDGARIAFLRTVSGTERTTELWVYDVADATERRIVDPAALLGGTGEDLSPEERARRERARQASAGVVGYATDDAVTVAVFALSSRLWLADLVTGETREIPALGAVIDPHLDPSGRRIAYVAGGSLHVVDLDGTARTLVEPDGDDVGWGLAEFAAAEELDRHRGFWWAPTGDALLVERADETPIGHWHIADPANPDRPATTVRYPAAGTANADVSLWLVALDGDRVEVEWDRTAYEYLARVAWSAAGPPLLQVLSRDQRSAQLLEVDPKSGATTVLSEHRDEAWIDLVAGVPARLPDGRLVTTVDDDDTRRLAIGGTPVTPAGLQVRSVLGAGADGVLIAGSTEPAVIHVHRVGADGSVTTLSSGTGVHSGAGAGEITVLTAATLASGISTVTVLRDGVPAGEIASRQEPLPAVPSVSFREYGRTGSRRRCCSRPATSRARRGCRSCSIHTAARTVSG